MVGHCAMADRFTTNLLMAVSESMAVFSSCCCLGHWSLVPWRQPGAAWLPVLVRFIWSIKIMHAVLPHVSCRSCEFSYSFVALLGRSGVLCCTSLQLTSM
jgi:hypothetical protein